MINLSRNKNICCGLTKVVAKSRAWVYFEQQILALLLIFHQTHNLLVLGLRIMASVLMGWILNLDLRLQSLNSSKTLFNLRQTSSKLFPIQYIVVSSAYISTFPSVIASAFRCHLYIAQPALSNKCMYVCNKFARALANQPISAPHFFNLQQMFLLQTKLITQGKKRETMTKTCNETMLRDKLKVFVSRISPPLRWFWGVPLR